VNVVDHGRVVVIDHRVVVRNVRDVGDVRVRHVHVANVILAHAIARVIRLTVAQRNPTHRSTAADTDARSETAATDEGHQSGRVDGTDVSHFDVRLRSARTPSPTSAYIHPATVVEWRITPRRIINPRITPRIDPRPVAVVIRSPSGIYAWTPYWPIFRAVAPRTVVVQVFVTYEPRRYITRRCGMILTIVALHVELIEIVHIPEFGDLVLTRVPATEDDLLTRTDANAIGLARALAFAPSHGNVSRVGIRVDVKAIVAFAIDHKRNIGAVDFYLLAVEQTANVDEQAALVKLQLRDVVIKVGDRKAGLLIDAGLDVAHADFSASILVGPDPVGSCKRTI
jgi:hypothetical protein